MMQITYVGPVPPIGGGISQHGGRLVTALRSLGHDVDVLSWRAQYPRGLYAGASEVRPGADVLAGSRRLLHWADPSSWVRAGRACRHRDLVVLPWTTPAQGPALWTIARAAGSGPDVVAVVHNGNPHEPFPLTGPLTRLGLARADRLVVHAGAVVDELAAHGVRRPVRRTAIPPSLAVEPSPMPPGGTVRLAFVGFIRAYKGPDLAIEVLGRLVDDGVDATLTLAGEAWDDLAPLRSLAASLGVADRVSILDRYLPDDELRALLADHHVAILPYRSATQSGVVPVAQGSGRPVVVTDVGGLAEQVEDGVSGRVVAGPDPAALAAATQDVLADLAGYAERAAAAVPTWDDVARAVVRAD